MGRHPTAAANMPPAVAAGRPVVPTIATPRPASPPAPRPAVHLCSPPSPAASLSPLPPTSAVHRALDSFFVGYSPALGRYIPSRKLQVGGAGGDASPSMGWQGRGGGSEGWRGKCAGGCWMGWLPRPHSHARCRWWWWRAGRQAAECRQSRLAAHRLCHDKRHDSQMTRNRVFACVRACSTSTQTRTRQRMRRRWGTTPTCWRTRSQRCMAGWAARLAGWAAWRAWPRPHKPEGPDLRGVLLQARLRCHQSLPWRCFCTPDGCPMLGALLRGERPPGPPQLLHTPRLLLAVPRFSRPLLSVCLPPCPPFTSRVAAPRPTQHHCRCIRRALYLPPPPGLYKVSHGPAPLRACPSVPLDPPQSCLYLPCMPQAPRHPFIPCPCCCRHCASRHTLCDSTPNCATLAVISIIGCAGGPRRRERRSEGAG